MTLLQANGDRATFNNTILSASFEERMRTFERIANNANPTGVALLGDALIRMAEKKAAPETSYQPRPQMLLAPLPLPFPLTSGGGCPVSELEPWWNQVVPRDEDNPALNAPMGNAGFYTHDLDPNAEQLAVRFTSEGFTSARHSSTAVLLATDTSVTLWSKARTDSGEEVDLCFSIPMYAMTRVSVDRGYSLTKPLLGRKERQMIAERGYGPMLSLTVTLEGTDGWVEWRIQAHSSFQGYTLDPDFADNLSTWLIQHVSAVRLADPWITSDEAERLTALSEGTGLEPEEKVVKTLGKTFHRTVEADIPGVRAVSAWLP